MRRDHFLNRPHDWTRTQRTSSPHAQSWRDLQGDAQDQLAAGRTIIHGCIVGLMLWALIALAVVGAVTLLG